MENKNQTQHFVNALIHSLYTFFIYFLFVVPFDLWRKATIRLSTQRTEKTLTITNITGLWPFLSFLKRFILDFMIDGLIFMLYILGILIAIVVWIDTKQIGNFFLTLISIYFTPIPLSLLRDFIQILISPFNKFISWVSKPAQYLDLEIKNK